MLASARQIFSDDAKSSLMNCVNEDKPPTPPPVVGAVLLAAGAGSRLGGRPKSLLELDGVPLIRRVLIALSDAGVREVVVVLGHFADAIETAVQGIPVTVVRNHSPDDGQPSSLRLGLRNLSGELDAVIVALADQPLIDAQDMAELIHAFSNRGDTRMVVPRVAGKPGNPVVIEDALRNEWLTGDIKDAGRLWREKNPASVFWLDSPNAHYRVDIDTEDDLARFREITGRSLRWPAP